MDSRPLPYPVSTVARLLRVSRAVCLKLIRDGEIEAVRTPAGLRVEPQVLSAWVERQIALAASGNPDLAKDGQKK